MGSKTLRRVVAIGCDTNSNARTSSEVQCIICMYWKLHLDFEAKSSIRCDMANLKDEIDLIKVRSGLFAIITARFEDANGAREI